MKPGLPGVPKINPFYVFEPERLLDMSIFWLSGLRAMLIEALPAAGKTSFVEQVHARLNVPLEKIVCKPDMQSYELFGQFLPQADGTVKWMDGPVPRAYRNGTSVLFDEYNNTDPAIATTLNMVLEGYEFTIPQTGEVITPARTTRFFATQNSVDSRAQVAGRNVMDVANDERFFYLEVDYLKPDDEKSIVMRELVSNGVAQGAAEQLAHITVNVANEVRNAFKEGVAAIEKPLSTRVVIRWASLAAMYSGALQKRHLSSLHYTVKKAVKMNVTMAEAVNEFITLKAGFDESLNQASAQQVSA